MIQKACSGSQQKPLWGSVAIGEARQICHRHARSRKGALAGGGRCAGGQKHSRSRSRLTLEVQLHACDTLLCVDTAAVIQLDERRRRYLGWLERDTPCPPPQKPRMSHSLIWCTHKPWRRVGSITNSRRARIQTMSRTLKALKDLLNHEMIHSPSARFPPGQHVLLELSLQHIEPYSGSDMLSEPSNEVTHALRYGTGLLIRSDDTPTTAFQPVCLPAFGRGSDGVALEARFHSSCGP